MLRWSWSWRLAFVRLPKRNPSFGEGFSAHGVVCVRYSSTSKRSMSLIAATLWSVFEYLASRERVLLGEFLYVKEQDRAHSVDISRLVMKFHPEDFKPAVEEARRVLKAMPLAEVPHALRKTRSSSSRKMTPLEARDLFRQLENDEGVSPGHPGELGKPIARGRRPSRRRLRLVPGENGELGEEGSPVPDRSGIGGGPDKDRKAPRARVAVASGLEIGQSSNSQSPPGV